MGYDFPGQAVDLGYGRGWLDRPAAASLFRIDRAIGHACQISEAGRTWDQQYRFWLLYISGRGAIALHPDTPSEHQKGKAVDSNEAQEFVALMEEHGWRRTVYRWVNGVWTLVERWHFEYFAHLDQHINDGQPANNQSEEDVMNAEQENLLKSVATDVANIKGFMWAGGDSVDDPNFVPAKGSLLQVVRNTAAHLFAGGTDAQKPDYLGAPGTIYHLVKQRVLRGRNARATVLPKDGSGVFIDQIQDQADTNTLLRELTAQVADLTAAVKSVVGSSEKP